MKTAARMRVSSVDVATELLYPFALFVGSCGYESRSRHIFEQQRSHAFRSVVLDYAEFNGFAYEQNRAAYERDPSVSFVSPHDFAVAVSTQLDALEHEPEAGHKFRDDHGRLRILVDVSSMDRDKISEVLLAILKNRRKGVAVTCLYSPGTYVAGIHGSEGTIMVNRPVHGLEGWSSNPDLPLHCILGLGLESDLALAALETLEPSETIAFSSVGLDERFDSELAEKNAYLLNSNAGKLVQYTLSQPFQAFLLLQTLVASITSAGRVVIVPLGPKVFAVISILVALGFGDDVSIWRVSAGEARLPEDRPAAGPMVGIKVTTLDS